MKIDAEPLIPMLHAAKQAKADLAASEDEWHALSRADQDAQLDSFLARDKASEKAYEEACRQLVAALDHAVINYGN
ncbi:hypothetical protein [Pseudomonas syringae group genomosp. 7]|uniref:hypothetical protein n=1 Tax=Pseudomonas syringae group genomosp. 7 TaxID=251699 RepID=UPI000EFED1B5|nr:hypothetical protein [Pseudomonas syringae group genomosp. 7]RMW17451.1 hypothetical protein ALO98_200365 [Pseudomonas syringae pv. tagetis]